MEGKKGNMAETLSINPQNEETLMPGEVENSSEGTLFDQAVADGKLQLEAIKDMEDLGNGYIKIVNFKGESFTGTKYQVKGWVEGVTGNGEIFARLLAGERIQRGPVDLNNQRAVDERFQDLYQEGMARRAIRENSVTIDLRDPNLVNNPEAPEKLRQAARTPEFQRLVNAKTSGELLAALSPDRRELQEFMRTPEFRQLQSLEKAMRDSDPNTVFRTLLDKSPQFRSFRRAAERLSGEGRALGRRAQKMMEEFASNSPSIQELARIQRDPQQYMTLMMENPGYLNGLMENMQREFAGVQAQIQAEIAPLYDKMQGLGELAGQIDLQSIPELAAAMKFGTLMNDALQEQVNQWGLVDGMPSSNRLDSSVMTGISTNINPRR